MQWNESLSMQDDKVDIIASIFRMAKSIERLCNRKFQTIGCTGSQSRILCFLLIATHHKDIYQKDIEKVFDIRPSSATGLLRELEQQGVMYRVTMSDDCRMKKIVLTEKAKLIQKKAIVISDDLQHKLRGDLTTHELDNFLNICSDITERAAKL